MQWIWILILSTIAFTLFASFYAGSETAISSAEIIKLQLKLKTSKHKSSVKCAIRIINDYAKSLTTIIIANNLIIIGFTTTTTYLFIDILTNDGLAASISLVYGSIVIVSLGEIIPKWIARKYCERWAVMFAWFIRTTFWILYPIVKLFNVLLKDIKRASATEEEIIEIVKNIQKEGVIDIEEQKLVANAFKFDDKQLDAILQPWKYVTYITTNFTKEEILNVLNQHKHNYLPVLDVDTNYVSGILNATLFYKLLYHKPNFNVVECIQNPIFCHSKMFLDDVIQKLRLKHQKLAIVINKENYNQPVGIITVNDLLNELVGNMERTQTNNQPVFLLNNNEYLVNGDLSYALFCATYPFNNWNLKEDKFENVKNWINTIKTKQKNNKILKYNNYTIKSKKINKKEIFVFTKINSK